MAGSVLTVFGEGCLVWGAQLGGACELGLVKAVQCQVGDGWLWLVSMAPRLRPSLGGEWAVAIASSGNLQK